MTHPRLRIQSSASDYRAMLYYLLTGYEKLGSINKLETHIKQTTTASHASFTNQGRVAIYAAVKAAISISKRRVILSPYTLYEVINMVVYAGGEPVFVDTVANTPFVSADAIDKLIDSTTCAILITHYHTPAPEIEKIAYLANQNSVKLIEDCAISFGATFNNKSVGTFGDIGIFSFGVFKIISAFYGGALISNNAEYYSKVVSILDQFRTENRKRLSTRVLYGFSLDVMTYPFIFNLITYPLIRIGTQLKNNFIINYTRVDSSPNINKSCPPELQKKPTETQAYIVSNQLGEVYKNQILRENRAKKYRSSLINIKQIYFPEIPDSMFGSWTEFPIVVKNRKGLYQFMIQNKRDIRYFYYRNCADLSIYKDFFSDCPNARNLMHNTLMLPLYIQYPETEIEKNISVICQYYSKYPNLEE